MVTGPSLGVPGLLRDLPVYVTALWLGEPMPTWVPESNSSLPNISPSQALGLLLATLFILSGVFSQGWNVTMNANWAAGTLYQRWWRLTTFCSWAICAILFPLWSWLHTSSQLCVHHTRICKVFCTMYLSNPVPVLPWGDQVQVQPLLSSSPIYIAMGDIRDVTDSFNYDGEANRLSRKSLL